MNANHRPSSFQYADAVDLDKMYLTPTQVAFVRTKIARAYLEGRLHQVEADKDTIDRVFDKTKGAA